MADASADGRQRPGRCVSGSVRIEDARANRADGGIRLAGLTEHVDRSRFEHEVGVADEDPLDWLREARYAGVNAVAVTAILIG
jgi:hypothetical protein